MAAQLAFPKEKIKVLLLEDVNASAEEVFRANGYTDITRLDKALPEAELTQALQETHIIGIRSKTQLTADLLRAAPRLLGVGAFCIGTDQIALDTAAELGIAVFNSPHSSTRSVAELTIGAAIMLMRRMPEKTFAANGGDWLKSHVGCYEVRGKTLGIIGYGRIGAQVSVLAEAMGMRVVFYDTQPVLAMGNAQPLPSMAAVLNQADLVSLHVPKAPENKYLIDAEALRQFKPGSMLINYARGEVIVAEAVAEALRSGHLAGLAADVFEQEPRKAKDRFSSVLQGLPNVMLSPHIGGSTEEAQANIGRDAAQKLVGFLDQGTTLGCLTYPEINLPRQQNTHRLLHLHYNKPGVLSAINRVFSELEVNIVGQYLQTSPLYGYVVTDIEKGETQPVLEELRHVPHTIKARSLY
jgi:D-3-phosphoglycerate dehydrogenase